MVEVYTHPAHEAPSLRRPNGGQGVDRRAMHF